MSAGKLLQRVPQELKLTETGAVIALRFECVYTLYLLGVFDSDNGKLRELKTPEIWSVWVFGGVCDYAVPAFRG